MAQDTKHWFNQGETLWDYRRKASKWHFDPDIPNEPREMLKLNKPPNGILYGGKCYHTSAE